MKTVQHELGTVELSYYIFSVLGMQTNLVEIEKYISPMPHRIRTNHLTWMEFVYRQVRPINKKIGQMPWRRNMLTSMCNDFSPAIARVCPQWHLQSKSVNLARKLLYWILPRPGYYLTLNNTSLFMEKNGESFPILRLYFANINITHVWNQWSVPAILLFAKNTD